MKNLRLEVFAQGATSYQLRFFEDGQTLPKTRTIAAAELKQFISDCQEKYERGTALADLGKKLFDWLNGAEGQLRKFSKNTLLQIQGDESLHYLAWELLRNDIYLCSNRHHPFTPQRVVDENEYEVETKNRPLRLLFMATSPENIESVLDFEYEEAMILEATKEANLELVVEESGSLKGLKGRVSYGKKDDFFDVVHISGHADIDKDGSPIFLLEDEFGEAKEADADAIASVFSTHGRYPRLLFLSGCKTAQNSEKALPSLAEALVKAGVPAVLGWAKSVYDWVAIFSAENLYQLLADGVDLVRAVALTRQALWAHEQVILKDNPIYQPQWHYLRLYSDLTPSAALVVKDIPIARREIRQDFLDSNANVGVCSRENFVGRRRLMQRALRLLQKNQRDNDYVEGVQLIGMGGLGKSSVALRLCERLAHILPKRFVCVGCVDETSLRRVLSNELPESSVDINTILNQPQGLDLRLIQLFNKYKVLHNSLFVFDNFEENFTDSTYQYCEPDSYNIIKALATAIRKTGSPSRLLITSRGEIKLEKPFSIAPLHLDSFRDADLTKKLSALRSQYLSKERQHAVRDLELRAIELGAGNPRLLERLYQVLANEKLPHEQILESLASKQTEFREELLLETLLSYQSADTRNLIARVALFEIFVPKEVLQAVFSPANVDACLQAAMAVGLIESYQGRFFVSRLLLPLLDGELDAAEKQETYRLAAQCLYTLWWNKSYSINEKETTELSRISHPEQGKELHIFSTVTGALAHRLYDVSRYNEAKPLYVDLLTVRKEIGDRKGEGATLNNLATTAHAQGDYATALRYSQDSLKIMQEIGDKQGEGATLNNLATAAHAQCDYATALRYLQDSLKIKQEIGDRQGEGTALNNISQIYRAQCDYATALRYLQDSLRIKQEIGDRKGEGATLNNLATAAHARGDHATALRYLQDSLKIVQEISDRQGEGATLNNISQIYDAQGDYATALRYLQDSLKIVQEIGDRQGEGATLNNISQIYDAQGDYATALRYLQDSLKIVQEIGDRQGEGTTLYNISQIYDTQGDYATALRYLQDSLRIKQEIGDKQGEGTTLHNISQIYYAQGDYATALHYLQDSLRIKQEIGDMAGMCPTLFNMGYIHLQNGESQEAVGKWVAAYQIAKKIGLAQALDALDSMAKQLGGDGLEFWERSSE